MNKGKNILNKKRGFTPQSAGFTLIEILVVIGIIALLATIVIVAINPARQFAQARNSQRTANVNAILNAIGQRIADNKGVFEKTGECNAILTTGSSTINFTGGGTVLAGFDLGTNCLVPTYIPSLPVDPDPTVASPSTGYEMSIDVNKRVMICAPKAAGETAISTNPPAICVTR